MKRSVLFSAALGASTALASAADIYTPPPYEPPVAYEPSAFNWTGVYAGIHGGFGGDRFEYPFYLSEDLIEQIFGEDDLDDNGSGQADITSSGFFAGGQIGANWQFAPQWVIGVEGDASWSDIKGKLGIDAALESGLGSLGASVEAGSKLNWFGTIRGRLGFLPTERFMVYATGGAAVGETESYANGSISWDSNLGSGSISPLNVSKSETNWGWTAGGGFEYAINQNITFKTEYLYIDLGSYNLIPASATDGNFTLDAETHIHTLKAGLNFLLGANGGSGADLDFYPSADSSDSFSWTGIYAGAMGGYGGDRFEYPFDVDDLITFADFEVDLVGEPHLTSSGFFAGGQIGANWQFASQWVVGVEADAAWSDIKGEVGAEADPCCGDFSGGDLELGSKVNWFGTIRGRLGFLPAPRFMIYGTGGAAYGETESYLKFSWDGDGGELSTSDTGWGWTGGGGFEYAITDNLTLKTEYLYVDLGSSTLFDDGGARIDVDTHFHTVKAGLNILFN